jgi:hypothetical protein
MNVMTGFGFPFGSFVRKELKVNLDNLIWIILANNPELWMMNCFFIENNILKPTKGKFFDRWA